MRCFCPGERPSGPKSGSYSEPGGSYAGAAAANALSHASTVRALSCPKSAERETCSPASMFAQNAPTTGRVCMSVLVASSSRTVAARAATRPVFGADTPPLAQTVRMMRGPAEVDLGFNLEVEREALVARANAFLSPTMRPRPETRLSGSADTSFPSPLLPHARAGGVGTVALNAWYARQVAGTTYSYYDLSLALLGLAD